MERMVESWTAIPTQFIECTDPQPRCGPGRHTSFGNSPNCYCGKTRNPAHRSWWQRFTDRRQRRNDWIKPWRWM